MVFNYDTNSKLHSTVMNECLKKANMENCEDFINLQSICNTANDFVKNFRKISFHGGNEPYIKEISRRIDNYLRQAGYIIFHNNKFSITNKQQVRKIVWYIILNTECSYKVSLENDPEINHCLNGVPQLTKCLTLNIIWNINLDTYVFELMEYAPLWLIVEWGEDMLDSLKYADPFTTLNRIEYIFKGLMKNIASYRLYKSIKKDEMMSVYHRLSDFSAALLCQFNTPPAQFEKWSTLKKSKYHGYAVYHLLQLSYEELSVLEQKRLLTVPEDCQLYDLLPQDKLTTIRNSEHVIEILKELFNMTLNTLENIVMLVSSNTFIDWFEIDFPDPKNIDDEYKLQSMVANLAHDLVELGNASTINEHDVFKKLKSIQYVRKDVSVIAKELKMSQLMEKLENNNKLCKDDLQILIDEYISRTIIYNNEECLETLEKCKNVLTPKQIIYIIETVNNEEDVEDENKEKLGEILSDMMDEMNEADLLKLAKTIIGSYQCPYKNIKFNCDIENVLYDTNVDKIEMLRSILKCPKKFLQSAIDVIQNTQKFNSENHKKIVEHYFKGFELFLPTLTEPCNHTILNTMLEQILSLHSCSDFQSVLHFNVMLYKSKFLTKSDYVKNVLVKSISQSKTEGFTQKCLNVGQIIQKILEFEDLFEHLPPLLVMFGIILNEARENIAFYGDRAIELLEKVISTIKELLNKFLPKASEKEKSFITVHLQNTSLLTKFYYQKLSLEKNQEVKTLVSFLHPNGGFESMKKPLITACFCEYLTKCTKKELLYLSESKQNFDCFNDAMKVIALSASEYESTFVLDFCLNNYNHLFQEMVRNESLTVNEMVGLLKGSSNILKVLPPNHKAVTSYAMLPYFKKLIESILQIDKEMKLVIEDVLTENGINNIISLDMMFPKD